MKFFRYLQTIVLIFSGLTLTFAGSVEGFNAKWYVTPDGTYTCDPCPPNGNEGNPFGSIQYAIDKASNGDTVLVADGTYEETIDYKGKIITVRSISGNPESCIIDANSEGDSVVWFHNGEYSSACLEGFTITNSSSSDARYGAGINIGSDIYSDDYASPTIRNCIIQDCVGGGANTPRGGGVYVGGGSLYSRPRFYDCQFLNNDSNMGGAVYVHFGATPSFYNCIFSGNSVSGGSPWGRVVHVEGDQLQEGSSINMLNCTIQNNSGGSWSIVLQTTILPSSFVNCIIRGGTGGLSYHDELDITDASVTPAHHVMRHCNVEDIGDESEGHFAVFENNRDDSPVYINAGAKNFHLSMDSPEIAAGTAGTSSDYDGNLRPYLLNNAWDVGAYEFNFAYLVENGINENTNGADPNGWNSSNAQWKTIPVSAAPQNGEVLADRNVSPGETFQSLKVHFYNIALPETNRYGVLRICTKNPGGEYGDTYGYLIDAADASTGNTLAEDDDSGERENCKIDYRYVDGEKIRYYLAVKGENTNPYDLYVWLQTDPERNLCQASQTDDAAYVVNNGNYYRCLTDNTTAEPLGETSTSDWEYLPLQEEDPYVTSGLTIPRWAGGKAYLSDKSYYTFTNTFFDAGSPVGGMMTVPSAGHNSGNGAKIDFADDVDVYKIDFKVPGTVEIYGFREGLAPEDPDQFEIVLKDKDFQPISSGIYYGTESIRLDAYNMAYCFVEISKKDGVSCPETGLPYLLKLDLYPVDHWYDVVSGTITETDWAQNGIMTEGGLVYNPESGRFEISGNGAGLDDDERDQAYYVYKQAAGDFTLSARVPELLPTEESDYDEHAGLMIRDNLSVGSKNIFAGFTPETDSNPDTDDGTFRYKYRHIQGANAGLNPSETVSNVYGATESYLKIRREGDVYTGFYSKDGSTWIGAGLYETELSGVGNIISNKAMVGMAVSSYNTTPDYMKISGGEGPCGETICYYKNRLKHSADYPNKPLKNTGHITGYAHYSFELISDYLVVNDINRPRLFKAGPDYPYGEMDSGFECKTDFMEGRDIPGAISYALANLPRQTHVNLESEFASRQYCLDNDW